MQTTRKQTSVVHREVRKWKQKNLKKNNLLTSFKFDLIVVSVKPKCCLNLLRDGKPKSLNTESIADVKRYFMSLKDFNYLLKQEVDSTNLASKD